MIRARIPESPVHSHLELNEMEGQVVEVLLTDTDDTILAEITSASFPGDGSLVLDLEQLNKTGTLAAHWARLEARNR